ncbi:hypothetical protein R1T08_02220 [Streptomyces sp. SBC-4]|nr:hypothetical protein [Streptomyces sp. SBC-4]MDV5143156.1 hypothetical protein [Streptomyces sp. SBC-4]
MRFLEIRRSGRTPQPDDFGDFPALISRTLSDLTSDERHVLRSVSLLDAFSVSLATQVAGLTRDAAALRLTERPFIREDQTGLWPFHLHQVVRSAIRNAEDRTDDRWSEQDWHRAATRALTALGQEWAHGPRRDRAVLIGVLRQGLRLARDFNLDALGWLTDAAFSYIGDSVWEPLDPPAHGHHGTELSTPADALVETLSALARRQREHRARTVERLTAVIDSGLLPAELQEMPVYYRAKALRDIGRDEDSRRGYQQVADTGGRLAAAARRGLAQAARLAGDFPTSLAAAQQLGWEGRHPARPWRPVLGPGGTRARGRGVPGRAARSRTARQGRRSRAQPGHAGCRGRIRRSPPGGRRTGPGPAAPRHPRPAGHHDQRRHRLPHPRRRQPDSRRPCRVLRTELEAAGLTSMSPTLEVALAFHQAVQGDHEALTATIARLRAQTSNGTFAYYTDIAHFMADLPLPDDHTPPRWLDGETATRGRWRALVTARRDCCAPRGSPAGPSPSCRPRPGLLLQMPNSLAGPLGGPARLPQGALHSLHRRTRLCLTRRRLELGLPSLLQLLLQAADPLGSLLGLRRHGPLDFPGLVELLLVPGNLGIGFLRRRTGALEIAEPRRITPGLLRRGLFGRSRAGGSRLRGDDSKVDRGLCSSLGLWAILAGHGVGLRLGK